MALPEPVWTDHDIGIAREVVNNPSSPIWKTWNEDPTKIAILRAIVSCLVRLDYSQWFSSDMFEFLTQKLVCCLHSYSL